MLSAINLRLCLYAVGCIVNKVEFDARPDHAHRTRQTRPQRPKELPARLQALVFSDHGGHQGEEDSLGVVQRSLGDRCPEDISF